MNTPRYGEWDFNKSTIFIASMFMIFMFFMSFVARSSINKLKNSETELKNILVERGYAWYNPTNGIWQLKD